jgi:hypothetical protein
VAERSAVHKETDRTAAFGLQTAYPSGACLVDLAAKPFFARRNAKNPTLDGVRGNVRGFAETAKHFHESAKFDSRIVGNRPTALNNELRPFGTYNQG